MLWALVELKRRRGGGLFDVWQIDVVARDAKNEALIGNLSLGSLVMTIRRSDWDMHIKVEKCHSPRYRHEGHIQLSCISEIRTNCLV